MQKGLTRLYKNRHGFGCRRIILVVLAAPCLKWIETTFNSSDEVHFLYNFDDCNDPVEFYNRVNGIASNPNITKVIHITQVCGSTHDIHHFNVVEDYNISGKKRSQIISDLAKLIQNFQKNFDDGRIPVNNNDFLIGIKCGGSTSLSQDKLNPFMGAVVDKMIDMGFRLMFNEPQETIGLLDEVAKRTTESDFHKWEYFIRDIEQKNKKYVNKGNIEGGLQTIIEKSLGSFKKTGTKNFRVYTIDEKVDSDSQLNFILGTNQEPKAFFQMIEKGTIANIFITGQDIYFGTRFSPTLTLGLTKEDGLNEFDYSLTNTFTKNDIDEFIMKIINILSGEKTISEQYMITS